MYKIVLDKPVDRFLKKHKWENIINQFRESVKKLSNNPYEKTLDITLLRWTWEKYRLRIWKYRFIYEISEDKILIIFSDAWKRWDIYKKYS